MADNVNHPAHYVGFSNGAEVIDITENLSFNLGNVVKYVARAGRKTADPREDLRKAKFYLDRELYRLDYVVEDPALPEGLTYNNYEQWTDRNGDLWRLQLGTWQYLDADDNVWVDIVGTPSPMYAPFEGRT